MFLETKKEGETTTGDLWTIAGLAAWLEKQPPDGSYDFTNPWVCATAQYLQSSGVTGHKIAVDCSRLMELGWDGIVGPEPRTFGEALKRARMALPKA